MAFFAASFPQAFCTALPLRPVSTTAADSAIRCRCGMAFIAASFLQAFCTALPLRPVSTTAANSAIRCRCGMTFIAASFPQTFCTALPLRPVSTTAENPAIQCRCGIAFSAVAESHSAWPLPQALSSYTLSSFHLLPPSEGAWSRHIFESALCPCFSSRRAFPTFRRCAVFPRFRLTFRRCVESPHLRERPVSAFLLPPCVSHLPKVCRIPVFSSHLPKVRGVVTASRAPCVRVFPAAVAFPPSEGVQNSRVFVSPSEGAQISPFSSHLPKVCSFKMKRPDALCRKTSIAITRILVFLPLFNRK